MQKTNDEPLLEMNSNVSYPVIGEVVVNNVVVQTSPNNINYQNDAILAATTLAANQVNQGYPPNKGYPPNLGYPNNQGYFPNQGYPPNQGYVMNQPQGFQPGGNAQYYVAPPPPRPQVVVQLPTFINSSHPKYAIIVDQYNQPCSRCSFIGSNLVSTNPGCAAVSWAVCLYCFTGILCFWIPLVVDSCKDIIISCSRCGNRKATIEKPCC